MVCLSCKIACYPGRDSLLLSLFGLVPMAETIFNLYYFCDKGVIKTLGGTAYIVEGSDEEKMDFLRERSLKDYTSCEIFSISEKNENVLTIEYYNALERLGRTLLVFEGIFNYFGAARNPLFCITPIVDGKPNIDISTSFKPFSFYDHPNHPKSCPGKMNDYLIDYLRPEGLDIPSLINDDYFKAIELLFNNKLYVSCMKLLASFIDTVSYLDYGDEQGCFIKWLKKYCDLNRLNITESQLWEMRNSILHMSNLDSRKVRSGKEKRISFCIAKNGYASEGDSETTYFNLSDLIDAISGALQKWISTYNEDHEKMVFFVMRYDRVLSDDRYGTHHY